MSLTEPPLSRPQDRAMINQRQKQKQAEKCNQLGKGMAKLWQSAFLLGPLADWTQGGREIVQTRVPGMRMRPAETHPGQRVTRSHNCTQTHTYLFSCMHTTPSPRAFAPAHTCFRAFALCHQLTALAQVGGRAQFKHSLIYMWT